MEMTLNNVNFAAMSDEDLVVVNGGGLDPIKYCTVLFLAYEMGVGIGKFAYYITH